MFARLCGVVCGIINMIVFTWGAYMYYVYGYITESPMPIWGMSILLGYGYIAVLLSTALADFVEVKLKGEIHEKS